MLGYKKMAVAPRTRRAGLVDIQNREIKLKEEAKKRAENMKKEQITSEDHEQRLKMLKDMGLIK
jgi:signal recognition particle GTPase